MHSTIQVSLKLLMEATIIRNFSYTRQKTLRILLHRSINFTVQINIFQMFIQYLQRARNYIFCTIIIIQKYILLQNQLDTIIR